MILGNDTIRIKICIGNVALEPVPLAVPCYLLFANDDFYVLADFKKLVEADAVIDLIKQKLSAVYQHVVDIAKKTL